jgi:hypothetical protein
MAEQSALPTAGSPPGPAVPADHGQGGEAPAGSWRHPGWSWTVGRSWLIPAGVAAGTLFLGAALGVVPVVVAGSWHDAQTRDQVWACLGLVAVGAAFLVATAIVYSGRGRLLSRNGTAYIIQEEAREWSSETSAGFLSSAARQFAGIIHVPGPGKLGGHWDWPLGAGAQHWDAKADELVRSFQALHYDDDPETPNGIFQWAWWAVAVAFGARVTAADRSLVLDVWQRPSRGRAGSLIPVPWSQRPHRFGQGDPPRLAEILPESAPREFLWPAQLTINTREPAGSTSRPVGGPRPGVLLVRLGRQSWGPIPALTAADQKPNGAEADRSMSLVLEDAAGLRTNGTSAAEIHELRCEPPAGSTWFPWPAVPSVATEVSAWIRRKRGELTGRPVVLGAVMPPEIALGLGILAGQDSPSGWPIHLWPIVYQRSTDALVVPRLDLGTAAFTGRTGGE